MICMLPLLHRYKMKDENKAPFNPSPSTKFSPSKRPALCETQQTPLLTPLRPPYNHDANLPSLDGIDLLLTAASLPSDISSHASSPTIISPLLPPSTKLTTSVPAIAVQGSRSHPVTVGRGGVADFKVGRGNKQISRRHVSIEWAPRRAIFEMTVLGLNGAVVDGVPLAEGTKTPLRDGALVDLLGERFVFYHPRKAAPEQTIPSEPMLTSELDMEAMDPPSRPYAQDNVGIACRRSSLVVPDVDDVEEVDTLKVAKIERKLFHDSEANRERSTMSPACLSVDEDSVKDDEEAGGIDGEGIENMVDQAGVLAPVVEMEKLENDCDYVELVVDAI
ncbi:hypothetical protein BC938DRAFT_479861, partial [Jimgerdemannia flammicorona]